MSTGLHRGATLLVVCTASFLTPFMGSSVVVALPQIGREFALDAVTLGWVATSYLLAAAVFLVPMGRLADILGRRRIFVAGIAAFGAATVLVALAPSAPLLLGFRALQGMSSSMVFSTSMPILISVYPPHERGRALGINVAAVYLGLSLGPFIGGILAQHWGWRSLFFVCAAVGALVLALTLLKLRGEWREARGERFDGPGALLYASALVALLYGFSRITETLGMFLTGAGLATLALFIWWEMRAGNPMLDIRLFRSNAVFAWSNLAALINYSATSATGFLLSLYLQYNQGMSPQSAGLVLVSQPVVMTLVSPLAGRLSDRIEPRILASAGMALTTAGLISLVGVGPSTPVTHVVASLLVLGLSFALFSSPNTNAVMSSVEKRHYGIASGVLGTMRLTGQMLSMGIATLLFALFIGRTRIAPAVYPQLLKSMRAAFLLFAFLCALGVLASLARGRVRGGTTVPGAPVEGLDRVEGADAPDLGTSSLGTSRVAPLPDAPIPDTPGSGPPDRSRIPRRPS